MKVKQDYKKDYREAIRAALRVMGVFLIFSLTFTGAYLYIEYRSYVATFERTQHFELKAIQEKIRLNEDNLKKLTSLTVKRIAVSLGDEKRIQSILSSTPTLLSDNDSFKFQKITYKKFSQPNKLITRFGTLPLEQGLKPSETPNKSNPFIFFDQNDVKLKAWVLDREGHFEGILEMEIPFSSFLHKFTHGETLSFVFAKDSTLLQKKPIAIYGKHPDQFWEYGFKNWRPFVVFFLFGVFSLVSIVLSAFYLFVNIKRSFKEKLGHLNQKLSKIEEERHELEENLNRHERLAEVYHLASHSYKKFQMRFHNHQSDQAHYLLRSLDFLMKFYKNPNASLSSKELLDIILSSTIVAEGIAESIPSLLRKEAIQLKRILEEARALFSERIYKSNLNVEINCPESLFYEGDPFVVEMLLINLIGKSLFMIPKNGKIEIKVTQTQGGLQIQIKDSGFPIDERSQNQIKQSFDFFLSKELFQRFCQGNGFNYKYVRDKNGVNINKILFPNVSQESAGNNVVPLFQ